MGTFSIFGDIKRISRVSYLDGENSTVIFGDVKIDFTRTPLEPGDHSISVITFFGDVKLRFPENVGLDIDIFTLFGESEIEQRSTGDEEKFGSNYQTDNFQTAFARVHVRLFTLFGDVDIIRTGTVEPAIYQDRAQHQLEYQPNEQVYDGKTRQLDHYPEVREQKTKHREPGHND